jgi:tetratricopeptide (TPR) repeat protein
MPVSNSLSRFQFLTPVICAVIFSGCASVFTSKSQDSDKATYYDSAYDDHNRAPASFVPSSVGGDQSKNMDPLYMRTQADYFFAVAEAQSYDGQHQKAVESFKMVLVYDQSSAEVPLRLSAEYVKLGLVNQALEQAEIAVSKNPKYIDARLMLGGLYSSLKVYDKALAQYSEVLKQEPENTEAPLYIGAVYAEQKQYDKAIKYFQSLEKNDDYQTPHLAHYYIARIHAGQDGKAHQQAAEQEYKKALEIKPEHVESVLGLSDLYTKMGAGVKATQVLATFQKEHGPSAHVAETLGAMYLEAEQYDLAYEQFAILEQNTDDTLNIKVKMALILIEQKKYTAAVTKLQEVLAQAPDSDKIRFYLAAVYEEIKQPEKAVENFQRVPSESQFYTEAVVHATYLMKQAKDLDGALKFAKTAADSRQDLPQLVAVYASLLDEKSDYKTAFDVLSKGVQKFPEQVQLRFFLGTVNDHLGNKEAVVQNMKKVIEMDPNHVQGLNYLAYTYSEMNQSLDEAESLVKRALEIEPKDAYIMDTYGWILFKQGKLNDSIRVLEAAYHNQPTESVIADHLGDAYFRAQMVDRAKNMYEKAAEFESDEKKAREIRSKITVLEKQELKPELKKDVRMPASAETTQQSE